MKILEKNPITILAEEGKVLVNVNEQPSQKHLANTLITLAKSDSIDNYTEIDISDIIVDSSIQEIQRELEEEVNNV